MKHSVLEYPTRAVPCAVGGLKGDCVEFLGPQSGANYEIGDGYGYACIDGRSCRAHKAAWVEAHGPIDDDLTIDHLCFNKLCLNTRHMEIVTRAENTRRSRASVARRAKTHCPQGHAYEGENLYVDKRGARYCVTCLRRRTTEIRERQKIEREKLRALTPKKCKNGLHAMTEENTKVMGSGVRKCAACDAARVLRARKR